jgi:hypothetical protein
MDPVAEAGVIALSTVPSSYWYSCVPNAQGAIESAIPAHRT